MVHRALPPLGTTEGAVSKINLGHALLVPKHQSQASLTGLAGPSPTCCSASLRNYLGQALAIPRFSWERNISDSALSPSIALRLPRRAPGVR